MHHPGDKEDPKEFSIRVHENWWGKCRSCLFWKGSDERRMESGTCDNPASDMYKKETWTEGHCVKWDSFDINTALELLDEVDEYERKRKENE